MLPAPYYCEFSPMKGKPAHLPWAVRRSRTQQEVDREMADNGEAGRDPLIQRGATKDEAIAEFMKTYRTPEQEAADLRDFEKKAKREIALVRTIRANRRSILKGAY